MFNQYSNRSISLKDAEKEVNVLHQKIKDLIYKVGYECENVEYNREDLDESFLHEQYYLVLENLDKINRRLNYLSLPVTERGLIRHNKDGRYELPSGKYFTSGDQCEILVNDSDEQYWIFTSIEHNGEDYYATALGREQSINGMMVRRREL